MILRILSIDCSLRIISLISLPFVRGQTHTLHPLCNEESILKHTSLFLGSLSNTRVVLDLSRKSEELKSAPHMAREFGRNRESIGPSTKYVCSLGFHLSNPNTFGQSS